MRKPDVGKKEFPFTEVSETFASLVSAGMIPDHFKKIRKSSAIALAVVALLETSGTLIEVRKAVFITLVDALLRRGNVLYIRYNEVATSLFSNPECSGFAIVYTAKSEVFTREEIVSAFGTSQFTRLTFMQKGLFKFEKA